jgi:hypothetical protein
MAHKKISPEALKGALWLSAFVALILAGVVAKRVFDHADWMVFFHLPAAVCLVVGFNHASAGFRRERVLRELSRRQTS